MITSFIYQKTGDELLQIDTYDRVVRVGQKVVVEREWLYRVVDIQHQIKKLRWGQHYVMCLIILEEE